PGMLQTDSERARRSDRRRAPRRPLDWSTSLPVQTRKQSSQAFDCSRHRGNGGKLSVDPWHLRSILTGRGSVRPESWAILQTEVSELDSSSSLVKADKTRHGR